MKQTHEMTTFKELKAASEYERYSIQSLVARALEVLSSDEYNEFCEFVRGWEQPGDSSWNKPAATISWAQ
ncbi:MAG: hypothetical protein GY832_16495 [Chloroflexi bacterium]|nr:hypothetical protein [Chloroflexota bacterium]